MEDRSISVSNRNRYFKKNTTTLFTVPVPSRTGHVQNQYLKAKGAQTAMVSNNAKTDNAHINRYQTSRNQKTGLYMSI